MIVIVENTSQEYEDEEEEFSKNWAYQNRFNKAHEVVYKKEEPKKVVEQSRALELLLGGVKSTKKSKITY